MPGHFLLPLQKWSREWICLLGRRRSAAIRDLLEFLTFKNSRRSQMKTTYLVYRQVNGVRRLVVATPAEWDAILKENRGLPAERRRYFIKDCFADGDELDCMYIEMTAVEYREWNSKNTVAQRKRKAGSIYSVLSLDAGVPEAGLESLHESVPSAFDLEGLATDHLLIEELKTALRKWKPWAEDLLELYLSGAKRSCTNGLCERYKLSDRAVQKRKTAFEKFVLDFLKK